MKTTTLTCSCDNVRLDVYLSENLDGLTRTAAQKLLDAGRVTLKDMPVRKNHKTTTDEIYTITQDEPNVCDVIAQDIRLEVVYEDTDLIVVNKPQGLVVHPAPGHCDGTLVNALLYHCGDSLSGIGGVIRPGIVHRIDKDTSGLIIAAKNDKAHLSLASQLSARTLVRQYEAVVVGVIKDDIGTIDAPIGRHPKNRKKQAVLSNQNAGRPAVTHFEVIARYNGYTHVHLFLETGRTHQIRVHLAHLGFPVLGDSVYGRKNSDFKVDGQCLHARKLIFIHPSSGEQITLSADLPDYFTKVLEKLEKKAQ
ncbi:MAG: RluA family pseudouridine synthase [Oscillospiraceae bacterium]|nr:RluA family pseudouridine synthase [Oscillospiraceae bacterium]